MIKERKNLQRNNFIVRKVSKSSNSHENQKQEQMPAVEKENTLIKLRVGNKKIEDDSKQQFKEERKSDHFEQTEIYKKLKRRRNKKSSSVEAHKKKKPWKIESEKVVEEKITKDEQGYIRIEKHLEDGTFYIDIIGLYTQLAFKLILKILKVLPYFKRWENDVLMKTNPEYRKKKLRLLAQSKQRYSEYLEKNLFRRIEEERWMNKIMEIRQNWMR